MSNNGYEAYVRRLRARHGDKFDESGLVPAFRDYYGMRVEVTHSVFGTRRGWVGGTTGWRPSLMLLKQRNSSGSTDLLTGDDKFVQIVDKGPR